jgi:hypothetical protein
VASLVPALDAAPWLAGQAAPFDAPGLLHDLAATTSPTFTNW